MIPPIANNFVAGETPDSALSHVEGLNDDGVAGILNLLGEHYEDPANATEDTEEYIQLARMIADRDADACVSVKPSQLGIDISGEVFEENLGRIVDAADCRVWVDMEDHTTTDTTLDAYEKYTRQTDGNMGLCVQANLKRTGEDLEQLADLPGKVRLVKGAYDEPAEIAHKDKDTVDAVYKDLLEYAFREFDGGIGVGSHDPEMISYARELHEEYGTPYEVQMLMGVRESAQTELAAEGIPVYQYIPYGSKWFSYFYRRVRERKENLAFAARAVLTG
ncbi:L-proline dehydrogenase [Halovenus aranensis]|uniref:proline dehydrogenase n=1 Tax=Halovenus aranensis TaxID=890420 RepID=A0A1G8THR9_9EURY|nr:proline dehydrogenase family protein [Halovenus aranensis]SDJ40983.1 L-proline dehydrogenase [Halovenus aranensis]